MIQQECGSSGPPSPALFYIALFHPNHLQRHFSTELCHLLLQLLHCELPFHCRHLCTVWMESGWEKLETGFIIYGFCIHTIVQHFSCSQSRGVHHAAKRCCLTPLQRCHVFLLLLDLQLQLLDLLLEHCCFLGGQGSQAFLPRNV